MGATTSSQSCWGKYDGTEFCAETFSLFYGIPQCKYILFGGCHDQAYDLNLRQYKHDEAAASRIIFLETTPAHPVYRDYYKIHRFKKIRFPNVFRSKELRPMPQISLTVAAADSPNPPPSPMSVSTPWDRHNQITSPPVQTPQVSKDKRAPSTESSVASESQPVATVTSSNPPKSTKLGKNGAPQINNYSATPKTTLSNMPYILLNKTGCRIDPPLPNVRPGDMVDLKRYIQDYGNLCKDLFLKGHCPYGSTCFYSHKLPRNLLNALPLYARSKPCDSGSSCRVFDCYFGHHCQKGNCDMQQRCWFAKYHGMDKVCAPLWDNGVYFDTNLIFYSMSPISSSRMGNWRTSKTSSHTSSNNLEVSDEIEKSTMGSRQF